MGAISPFKILQSSAKYEIAVSLISNLSDDVKNCSPYLVKVSINSAGNFSLPTAAAS